MCLKKTVLMLIIILKLSSTIQENACGRKSFIAFRIFNGQQSEPNSWPWLVVFHHTPKNVFFCGGSLITAKHVLTGKKNNTTCIIIHELTKIKTKPDCKISEETQLTECGIVGFS